MRVLTIGPLGVNLLVSERGAKFAVATARSKSTWYV